MRIQDFKFLDSTSTSGTSNVCVLPVGAESMSIQVSSASAINLAMYGRVDKVNGDFMPLAVINLSTFAKGETITNAGVYAVAIDGMKEVKCVSAGTVGSVTVVGVTLGQQY